MRCINFNNSIAQGNVYSSNSNYFTLKLKFDYNVYYLKNNNSPNNSNIYFNIFFPISSLDLYNFTNPYTMNTGSNFYSINLNQKKTVGLTFKIDEIPTDINYIGTSYNKDQIVSSKYKFDNIDEIDTIFKLYLTLDPIKNIYNRSYIKFQDVINNVNSTVSIIFALFKFLLSYFNRIKLRENLIEEAMLFKIDMKEN